jgi:hypothetical protein
MAWRSSTVLGAPSNRDLAIRPLGLGEVIDRAVALTLRHFRPLFLWMLLLQAPAIAASRVQLAGAGEVLASFSDAAAALDALKALSRTSAWVVGLLFVLQAAAAAICAVVVAPSLGGGEGIVPLPAARRAAAVATAALASLAILLLLPLLGALPGAALLPRARSPVAWVAAFALFLGGAGVGFLLAVLRTLLVPAVAAIEGRPHFAAVRRASALMRSAPGLPWRDSPALRASLVLFATFAIAIAVNVIVGVPRGVIGRLAGGSALLPTTLSLWAEIPLGIFETVASAALQPFSLVAVAVLYFDRRARREGLDLERFAGEVEAATPP